MLIRTRRLSGTNSIFRVQWRRTSIQRSQSPDCNWCGDVDGTFCPHWSSGNEEISAIFNWLDSLETLLHGGLHCIHHQLSHSTYLCPLPIRLQTLPSDFRNRLCKFVHHKHLLRNLMIRHGAPAARGPTGRAPGGQNPTQKPS